MPPIRYLVFDLGRVLMHYEPEVIAAQFAAEEDVPLLSEVIFRSAVWDGLDHGTLTQEEALQLACRRLPARLHEVAAQILCNWIYHLPPIEGMAALLTELRDGGIPLFLLSNISVHFAEHAAEFPVLSLFRRCIFSGPCRMKKPNSDIFLHLLKVCDIPAEETLFIDDTAENIAAAERLGIRGYLFDGSAAKLRAFLAEEGLLPAADAT